MKNRTTAGLLALLLGGIGAQFFYLGRTGTGIACLLFCWTGIPIIIGIINGISYLSMSDGDFNMRYNGGKGNFSQAGASTSDELSKLFELKEKGAITEAEYNARKSQLLR